MNSQAITLTKSFEIDAAAKPESCGGGFFGGIFFSVVKTPTRFTYRVGLHGKACKRADFVHHLSVEIARNAEAIDKHARTVECKAEVLYVPGSAVSVTLKGQKLLHRKGTYSYYHVGAIPRGQEGRKVFQGPMVAGPWACASESATVISASEAHRKADAAERAAALEVDNGSRIWVDGVEYTVEFGRFSNEVKLVPVEA